MEPDRQALRVPAVNVPATAAPPEPLVGASPLSHDFETFYANARDAVVRAVTMTIGERDLSVEAVDDIRSIVLDLAVTGFGGSFSGEHGLGRINHDAYAQYTPAPERELAAAVVRAFSASVFAAACALTRAAAVYEH